MLSPDFPTLDLLELTVSHTCSSLPLGDLQAAPGGSQGTSRVALALLVRVKQHAQEAKAPGQLVQRLESALPTAPAEVRDDTLLRDLVQHYLPGHRWQVRAVLCCTAPCFAAHLPS